MCPFGKLDNLTLSEYNLTQFIENHDADVEIDRQVEELSVRSGPTLWQCGGCGKQASQRGDLRKHIEAIHLNIPGLHCPHCSTFCASRNALRMHLYRKHRQ